MTEESTTPDLVELARHAFEAGNSGDLDLTLSFYSPDPVWDMSRLGMGTFEGPAAIRGFFQDWIGAYEEWEIEAEEILDLGNGVILTVVAQRARPVASVGSVQLRYAAVTTWTDGKIARVTNYSDLDEAHAAAKRLAESRG